MKHVKLEPRANAAAWRRIKCPVCQAGPNEMCVNVLVEKGKPRAAHLTRIQKVKRNNRHVRTRKRQKTT